VLCQQVRWPRRNQKGGWSNVVGIFPNEDAVTRLVGALMMGQNDE
jgi:hypothetical protein